MLCSHIPGVKWTATHPVFSQVFQWVLVHAYQPTCCAHSTSSTINWFLVATGCIEQIWDKIRHLNTFPYQVKWSK